jgi:hypothetical protein
MTRVALMMILVLAMVTPRGLNVSKAAVLTVTWAPSILEVSMFTGTVQTSTISFSSTEPIQKASLFVAPEIARFLTIDSSGFNSVLPNEQYQFPIKLQVPASTGIGTYTGTVHLRNDKQTVPATLKVTIHVGAPSSNVVPLEVAEPSSDRITRDVDGQQLVKDEIDVILAFNTPEPSERIASIASQTGGVIIGAIPTTLTYQLKYNASDLASLEQVRLLLETLPDVESASHHFLSEGPLSTNPNDTEYSSWDETNPDGNNWGLEFIKAPSAWDSTTGDRSVIVGVIDGDFDKHHGDLNDNIVAITGTRTTVFEGHGTHVAGTIAAEGNNNKGVAGVCWNCSLRLYDFGGTSAVKAQESMVQAVNEGARIVNMSLGWIDTNVKCGTPTTSSTLQKVSENNAIFGRAILYAERQAKDVLWVFAAGNECRDAKYQSPASLTKNFPLNTLAVASINQDGALSSFSNRGNLVTVAAPGQDILSTLPRDCPIPFIPIFCSDKYGVESGTSMAAPHVSGLAALVRAKHPDFSSTQVKKCIVSAAQSNGAAVAGQEFKVINAPSAITCQGTVTLPSKVDMVFSLDLTGSMGGEISRVKAEIETIITRLRTEVSPSTDFRFGVVSYEDYAGFFDSRSCGSSYASSYGSSGDAPFRINRSLTPDANAVKSAVSAVGLGSGSDSPESYGRVFWELGQTDTGTTLGWRADALKLVVNFGDDIPHDTNLNQGVASPTLLFPDTGIDPGRNNAVDCGGDDIDFQDEALVALSSKGIRLLHIDSSGNPGLQPYWQYWTSTTGGAFAAINSDGSVSGGLNLTDLIVSLLGLIPSSSATALNSQSLNPSMGTPIQTVSRSRRNDERRFDASQSVVARIRTFGKLQ